MALLSLGTYLRDGHVVVSVRGEIDTYTAGALRTHLRDVLRASPRQVVIDLTEVEFMDSTGLGVLVGARRRMGEDATLRVVCPHEAIRKIFRITGLDHLLPLHHSVAGAVAATAPQPGPPPVTGSRAPVTMS